MRHVNLDPTVRMYTEIDMIDEKSGSILCCIQYKEISMLIVHGNKVHLKD